MAENDLTIRIGLIDEASDKLVQVGDKVKTTGDKIANVGSTLTAKISAPLALLGGFSATASAQFESLSGAYDLLAKRANINGEVLLSELSRVSDGTISQTNLIMAANRAMSLGVGKDIGDITTLLEIARVKGRAMGLSTEQAFSDIVTGLGRGSPLILDNLGIVVNATVANEEYAKSIGKAASELTDAEKKQALINTVVAQGAEELAAAGEITATNAEKMQQLSAAFSDFKVALGDIIIDRLVEIFGFLVEKLQWVGDALQNLSPFWQDLIVNVGLVLVALGPVIFIIGNIISLFGTFISIIGTVGQALVFLTTSPIGLLILAIGALIAAGVWLYKHWDEVKAFAIATWTIISTWVTDKMNAISALIESATAWITEKWTVAWTAIGSVFQTIWDGITRVAEVVFAIIIGIIVTFLDWLWPSWLETFTKIYNWFAETWEKAKAKFTEFTTWFSEWFTKKMDAIKLYWEKVWGAVSTFFGFIWESIAKTFSEKWAVFTGLLEKGIGYLQSAFAGFGSGVANLFSGIWEGIKSVFVSGINWVIDKINFLIEKYNKLPFAPQIDLLSRVGGGGGGGGQSVSAEQALSILNPGGLTLASGPSLGMGSSSISVNVSGNNFYGDDSAFASKVGNTILGSLKESTNTQR